MSYASAAALQVAIHERLAGALAVPVLDAVPAGVAPETYVLLGPEDVRDAADRSGAGAEHRLVLAVVSRAAGFADAKAVAAELSDALLGAPLVLGRGRVVGLWFQRATARRLDGGGRRRIDLVFRARVTDI